MPSINAHANRKKPSCLSLAVGVTGLVGVSRHVFCQAPQRTVLPPRSVADYHQHLLREAHINQNSYEPNHFSLENILPAQNDGGVFHDLFKSLGTAGRIAEIAVGPAAIVFDCPTTSGTVTKATDGETIVGLPLKNRFGIAVVQTKHPLFKDPGVHLTETSIHSQLKVFLGEASFQLYSGETFHLNKDASITIDIDLSCSSDQVTIDIQADALAIESVQGKVSEKVRKNFLQSLLSVLGFAFDGKRYMFDLDLVAQSSASVIETLRLGKVDSSHIKHSLEGVKHLACAVKDHSPLDLSLSETSHHRPKLLRTKTAGAITLAARLGLLGSVYKA